MSRVRTLVATEFLLLLGLFVYVGLAFVVEQALSLTEPVGLGSVTALGIATIPGLLWLGYFYAQDRLEPEPKHSVFGVFLLGALVAAPVAEFAAAVLLGDPTGNTSLDVFSVERWVAAIAIVGMSQELCKYAVIRYTLYASPEFDAPLDGVIYMSAAGIGFATYESHQFLQGQGAEVLLTAAAARTVITALAHASLAGILGFALSKAKFGARTPTTRALTLVAGLTVTASLNGCFFLLIEGLGSRGLGHSPWTQILASLGFAAMLLLTSALLMHRLMTFAASEQRATARKTAKKDGK